MRILQQDLVTAAFQLHVIVIGHAVIADDAKPFIKEKLGKVEPDESGRSSDKGCTHERDLDENDGLAPFSCNVQVRSMQLEQTVGQRLLIRCVHAAEPQRDHRGCDHDEERIEHRNGHDRLRLGP